MIESIHGGYSVQGMEYTRQGRAGSFNTQPSDSTYSVDISDSGKLVSAFFSQMGVEYTPGQAISLQDLKNALENSKEDVSDTVNSLLLENDISPHPPIELTTDQKGVIRVKGKHPQKSEIEKLVNETPGLANDFRKTSALSSLVREADKYIEFAKAYEQDPYAAVAKYSHMFSRFQEQDKEFSMTFDGG